MIRILSCLLLVLLVTGCTDIQTAGPVQEVPLGPEQLGVQIAPEPPQPGVSPVRLVEGFVQAMADSEADYAVAREYLTSQASKEWVPQDGGVVYKGVVGEDGDAVFVTGTRTGVLDERGRFTAVSDELVHDFGVVMVDGEWRISAPPAGLLVSDYIFERYWSHATVYFMASGESMWCRTWCMCPTPTSPRAASLRPRSRVRETPSPVPCTTPSAVACGSPRRGPAWTPRAPPRWR